ncbi:hypothetical protein [Entomobacter blattae]|uniref:hypothetical protein n=1 Tax=Entomobacter blattae TaxID=2762277 RepID=UPI00193B9F53|nr:hypothetical protein [Entomobacter blattae]
MGGIFLSTAFLTRPEIALSLFIPVLSHDENNIPVSLPTERGDYGPTLIEALHPP